jgi:hypothetical protein
MTPELRTDLKKTIITDESLRYCEIYKITNTLNGKIYIGQAVSHRLTTRRGYYNPHGMEGRFNYHITEAFSEKQNQCRYLNNAIRKHGKEHFTLTLLRNCSLADADSVEIEEISNNNSLFPSGYNLTTGGRGFQPTPEYSKSLSDGVKNYNKDRRLDKFKDVKFDVNESEFESMVKPLNKNNVHLGWYVNINGKVTAFNGKHIPLDESKKMAIDFLKTLRELSIAKHLVAGTSLEPSLPLTSGNFCEELG